MKKYIRADVVDPLDENTYDLISIIQDPNTRPSTLLRFIDHRDHMVRLYLATCPHTPEEGLAELAWDEDRRVRRAVAENLNTPVDVLAKLAKSHDKWVATGAATNPNASEEILRQLSRGGSELVLNALLRNPSTPADLKASLVDTTTEYSEIVVMFNEEEYYKYRNSGVTLDRDDNSIYQDMQRDIKSLVSDVLTRYGYINYPGYIDGLDELEYGYDTMYSAWCDQIICFRDQQNVERAVIDGMKTLGFSADCAADGTVEKRDMFQ